MDWSGYVLVIPPTLILFAYVGYEALLENTPYRDAVISFYKMFFNFYVAVGFISLGYIAYHTVFIGPFTIQYDGLKPLELVIFLSMAIIFILKGALQVAKCLRELGRLEKAEHTR